MAASHRFSQASIDFIVKASRQKSRRWLDKNREQYERVLVEPMRELLESVERALRAEARGYRFPRRGFARILRSPEGAREHGPFRDWIGVAVSRESTSRYEGPPNLYFHISEDEGIFSAGGLYMPSARQTRQIRKWIAEDPSLLEGILRDRTFRKRFPEGLGRERVLKTKPRDYPTDHPRIEWLKLSGFYVWREIGKRELFSREFADLLIQDWHQCLRFNAVLDRYTASWPKERLGSAPPVQGDLPLPEARPFLDDWEDES